MNRIAFIAVIVASLVGNAFAKDASMGRNLELRKFSALYQRHAALFDHDGARCTARYLPKKDDTNVSSFRKSVDCEE